MAKASLAGLPDEVLHYILCHTLPSDAAALERTSHRFRNVTNEPLLWRYYCKFSFKYWDHRHDIYRKFSSLVSSVLWKELFIARCRTDAATTEILNDILASQVGRIEKFQAIVDLGYDTKDTLLRHARAGPDQEDYLARR